MQNLENKSTLHQITLADPKRRSFLGGLLGVCTAAVGAALSLPLVRFALYPLRTLTTETKWSDAGAIADFAPLTTPVQRTVDIEQVDGWRKSMSAKSIYITRDSSGKLRALSAICPHLGCSVQWASAKGGFACPCHGASYAPDGTRLGGPAPRGMDSLETSERDGRLLVRYQYFRQLIPNKEVIG